MKLAIYIDIQENDYKKYNIRDLLIGQVLRCFSDIESKISLIEHPIVYRDEISKEIKIK